MNPSETPQTENTSQFISNQQRLGGYYTRVIFEFPKGRDNLIRLYACFAKENSTDPIKKSSVKISLMDTNGNKLSLEGSSPGDNDNLVEICSGATTAQAVYDFGRSSGQNPLFAAVQLGDESVNFQFKDAIAIPGATESAGD